jgi:hypothetical protein
MAMIDTKRISDATKPAAPVTKKGRPPITGRAFSNAERSRRARAKAKARPKPVRDASEIFQDICNSRAITSAFHRVLAEQVTDALIEGRLSEALKGLDALPAPVRAEETTGTNEATSNRQRFMAQIMNAVAADTIERRDRIARGVGTEVDHLRERIDEIERPPALEPPEGEAEQSDEQDERLAALEAENRELRARLGEVPPPPDDHKANPTKPQAVPSAPPLTPAEAAAREDARAHAKAIEQTRKNERLRQDYAASRDNWWSSGPFQRSQ